MTDYVNQEFQRILSNPQNEIVSESLKDRLEEEHKSIRVHLCFEDAEFECSLESFSKDFSSKKMNSISFMLNNKSALKIMSEDDFSVKFSDADIELNNSDIKSYNCFKYQDDNYVLELELNTPGVLND